MAEITSLYLHGLGSDRLRQGEKAILKRHVQKGITVVPAYIDWRSKETFPKLLDRITEQASGLLDTMTELGRLVLEGSSAGGSLAVNVSRQLNDPRILVVSHSGRMRAGELSRWDSRNLERCAHLGMDEASQSFYDSVLYCENETMPLLTHQAKVRMLITRPWADEIVPVSTMYIDGVRTITVPMIGHAYGIGLGMLAMPSLVRRCGLD